MRAEAATQMNASQVLFTPDLNGCRVSNIVLQRAAETSLDLLMDHARRTIERGIAPNHSSETPPPNGG